MDNLINIKLKFAQANFKEARAKLEDAKAEFENATKEARNRWVGLTYQNRYKEVLKVDPTNPTKPKET